MSGKLMGRLYAVLLHKPLRDVALAMADHARDDGTGVFPSIGRLAWKLDLNRRTVQRHVRELEDLGLLEKVKEATRYQPAEYRIDVAVLVEKPEYAPPNQHRAKPRCDIDTAPSGESRCDTSVAQVRHEHPQVRHDGPPGAVRTPPESPVTVNETPSEPNHVGVPESLRETNGRPRKVSGPCAATAITGSIRRGVGEDAALAALQELVDDRLATGDAPATVANALCPIQAFYRRAIDRNELVFNPAAGVDVPEQESAPKRIATGTEAAALIAALADGDRSLWATAFYAGLRRGELQALRWCDVDLGASLISVERGWDQYEGPQTPKSASSRRTVPLLAILRDHLDEHKLRLGLDGNALVFGRGAETPFSPPATDRRAQRAWNEAELQPVTLHECRHTFASLLIDAGANPKAIQTFMGHSKIQTTFDTYGHLFPGSRDEVRERMDAYLAAPTESVAT